MPCWLCHTRIFPSFLVQLKAVLWVSPWMLCVLNVLAVILLSRRNQNYPSVALTFGGGFWSHGAQEFSFPPQPPSWILPPLYAL
jgi:hypothetical protein